MKKLLICITVTTFLIVLVIINWDNFSFDNKNRDTIQSNSKESRSSRISRTHKIDRSQNFTQSQSPTPSAREDADFSELINLGDFRGFHDKVITDPGGAIDYIEKNFESINPELRQGIAMSALQAIARASPELALQWVGQSKIFWSERDAVQMIFSAWEMISVDDVKLALRHASAFKNREWADSFIPSTVAALAQYSNDAALDWVKDNLGSNIEIYRQSLQGVFLNIADKDPSVFWKTINEFETDPLVTKAASLALINLSIKNIDAAENLLDEIRISQFGGFSDNDDFFTRTINSIARQNISENPDKILSLLTNSGITEEKVYDVFGANMFYWIRESPDKALGWLNSRSQSEKYTLLSNDNVIHSIAEFSPEKAVTSIDEQRFSPKQKIQGYNATLHVWSVSSPSSAFEWVSTKDPVTQIAVINSFVDGMFSVAPDLVGSYLASPNIAPEARAHGVQRLNQLGTKK